MENAGDPSTPLYVPLKLRRLERLNRLAAASIHLAPPAAEVAVPPPSSPHDDNSPTPLSSEAGESLLQMALRMKHQMPTESTTEGFKEEQEEARIMASVQRSLNMPLMSVQERARGIKYSESMQTGWRVPRKYQELDARKADRIRESFFIQVQGEDCPPPIAKFEHMNLPKPMMRVLRDMGIKRPTLIQMQGLPCALQGRDMIGIAFTGSGKTFVFVLPMILRAMEAELRIPLTGGEGPIGLVICPSRELASQTIQTVKKFVDGFTEFGFPRLKTLLMIGGVSLSDQSNQLRYGVHMIVATPGRLGDMLSKRRMHLRQCTYLTLDEADRLVDLGFEEEIRAVFDYFAHQRQTLLFSATMPRKIQEFATSALVNPILCNVGRAGAANLDVVQEVEYVKEEARLPYLLKCLQKTAPPTVIFCEHKRNVDEVHEYLLLKGVEAVAIHGGLTQTERQEAIEGFKSGSKDVLVGTDVASKGLDFPDIQHVINFDMPKEIENYVHRIGRTGRCGRTGTATTFVNRNVEELTLMDLRALLKEADQKVPPFLDALSAQRQHVMPDYGREIGGVRGCGYCGGLGHRITDCPKLETQKTKQISGHTRDLLTTGSRYGGSSAYGGNW